MPGVREKSPGYPAQTSGSRLAALARAKANAISEGKRTDLFNKGMAMILDARQLEVAIADCDLSTFVSVAHPGRLLRALCGHR